MTGDDIDFALPDAQSFGRITYTAPPEAFTDMHGRRHNRAVVSWTGKVRVTDGKMAVDPIVDGASGYVPDDSFCTLTPSDATFGYAIPMVTFGTYDRTARRRRRGCRAR